MKTKSLTLLLLFFCTLCLAQDNFQPGHIFHSPTDSVSGLINNKIWDKNPEKIEFTAEGRKTKTYLPGDIYGFKVGSYFYTSAKVEIDHTPTEEHKIIFDTTGYYLKTKKVFLQMLLQGSKSLLRYKSQRHKVHFFIENAGEVIELRQIKRVRYFLEKRRFEKFDKYKGQLQSYLSDCPSVGKEIINLELKEKSLADLFNFYFNCTGSTGKNYIQKKKNAYKISAVLGTNKSILIKTDTEQEFQTGFNPYFGVGFEVNFPSNLGANSLYLEAAYFRMNLESDQGIFTLNSDIINVSGLYRYTLVQKQKINPFIHIGGGTHLRKSGLLNASAIAGLGIDYKNISAELRYDRSLGYLDKLTAIKILARYSFKL